MPPADRSRLCAAVQLALRNGLRFRAQRLWQWHPRDDVGAVIPVPSGTGIVVDHAANPRSDLTTVRYEVGRVEILGAGINRLPPGRRLGCSIHRSPDARLRPLAAER